MKTAILSDIHGNLEALEAVLRDIDKNGGVDRFWCLGDTVDYGPQPHECLERVRQLNALSIIGNHDAAACGKIDYRKIFSGDFLVITGWTEEHLSAEDKTYLASLPLKIETSGFTLVHGSPREPFWEYILNRERAAENLPFVKTKHCLVGHTHVSAFFEFEGEAVSSELVPFTREADKQYFKDGKFSFDFKPAGRKLIELNSARAVINPGSVGQQRDKDPRAAYAVFNDEDASLELKRVEYNVNVTRQRMMECGLPEWLSNKLAAGI